MVGQNLAYRIVFETFDADNDGWLDASELHDALHRMGGAITLAQSQALVALSSNGGASRIDVHSFVDLLRNQTRPSESAIRRAFDALDVNGDGVLTATEVSGLMTWVGVHADDDVQAWIAEMDTDNDGRVTFHEFAAMVNDH